MSVPSLLCQRFRTRPKQPLDSAGRTGGCRSAMPAKDPSPSTPWSCSDETLACSHGRRLPARRSRPHPLPARSLSPPPHQCLVRAGAKGKIQLGSSGAEQIATRRHLQYEDIGTRTAATLMVGLRLLASFQCAGFDHRHVPPPRACSRPAVTPSATAGLHRPQTSIRLPSNSSLRRNTFTSHGFSSRPKITKWPTSAPHRSM